MSCEECGYGRWSHCPICIDDPVKIESTELRELREDLADMNRAIARGEQVDQIELAYLLDDIKELENEN